MPCTLRCLMWWHTLFYGYVWGVAVVAGASGVCLGLGVWVVRGVHVRSACVEIRGQLWVSVLKCLFETSFISLDLHVGPAPMPVNFQGSPVSISIPSWDYIESCCSQLFR